MREIVEKLKIQSNRSSTAQKYLEIWRIFNQFIIKLDVKPRTWEERLTFFCAYLVQQKRKSTTIRSYVSAIKWVLKTDGYSWNQDQLDLTALTKACRLHNDVVRTRLPISSRLLELLLFKVERLFPQQLFITVLYQTVFSIAYYGLLRIGEVAKSEHTVLARNIHLGMNKNKLLIVLYSSKTHGKESVPQQIKITQAPSDDYEICFYS